MIAAMTLCAHLVAAHVAAHCSARPPGPAVAVNIETSAGKGFAMAFTAEDWRGVGLGAPIGSPEYKKGFALFTDDMSKVATSAWAHVIVVVPTNITPELNWWIQAIDTRAHASYSKAIAQADIVDERSNPAGVVDLVALHTSGEELQEANKELAQNAIEYKRMTGLSAPAF